MACVTNRVVLPGLPLARAMVRSVGRVVALQLEKAGVRLADALNAAAASR